MIIDTHCHLASPKYENLDELRRNSLALGVGHCISQGTAPDDWELTLAQARQMPDFITPCLATHPSECMACSDEQLEQMESLCRANRDSLAAIGESGLDYYWDAPEGCDTETYYARQKMMLERHFALAAELGLNISLHTRERKGSACFDDAFAIARNFPTVRPVFHCFIGTQQQAERIFCDLDGMISFTGLITFRKTEAVQAVAAWCPADPPAARATSRKKSPPSAAAPSRKSPSSPRPTPVASSASPAEMGEMTRISHYGRVRTFR